MIPNNQDFGDNEIDLSDIPDRDHMIMGVFLGDTDDIDIQVLSSQVELDLINDPIFLEFMMLNSKHS